MLVEPPGYYPYRTTETIAAGERVDVTYYVEKASYNPYDVTVTATAPAQGGEPHGHLGRGDRQDPRRRRRSAGRRAELRRRGAQPSRASSSCAARRPRTRRSSSTASRSRSSTTSAACRASSRSACSTASSSIPGNFSPMYGRATGGIVDVQVKKLKPKKMGGYADVSLLDTGVYLEVPLGNKGGIAVAGRRSYIDGVLNAAVPSDAPVNLVTAPVYYDFQLLGNYRPSPAHDLRAFFLCRTTGSSCCSTTRPTSSPGSRATGSATRPPSTARCSPTATSRASGSRTRCACRSAATRSTSAAASSLFDVDIYTAQLRDTRDRPPRRAVRAVGRRRRPVEQHRRAHRAAAAAQGGRAARHVRPRRADHAPT